MAKVPAYNTKTGEKLPYLVPEAHIDHPILGRNLSRLPSQVARKQETTRPTPEPVVDTNTEAPATGDEEGE